MRLLCTLILLLGLSAQAQITISNATLSGVTSGSALLATANNFTASNTFSGGMMVWGDANKTNGVWIGPSGEVLSNAVGSVTIAGGNVTASGQYSGNGVGLSNVFHCTQTIVGAAGPVFNTNATYWPINGGASASSSEANVSTPFLAGGILTNFICRATPLGADTNMVATIMTNGVASSVVVSVVGNGSAVVGNSGTASAIVPANVLLSIKFIGNNPINSANLRAMWSFEKIN